jgi:hypothetical protein
MDNMIVKVTKIITILIMAAGAVFTALVIWNADDLETSPALAAKLLDPYFGIAVALIVLGIASVLLFAIRYMIMDPKAAVRALISLAILGGIYFLSYVMASGNTDAPVYEKFQISSEESKIIGSLIIYVYILGSLAILSVIGSGVYKMILKMK